MAITPVQGATNSATGATSINSIAASWGSPTTAGNYLIAVVCFQGAGGPGTITPPAGWVLRGIQHSSGINYVSIFEGVNAASQSGSQNFTCVNLMDSGAICIEEYSGVAASSYTDGTDTAAVGSASGLETGGLVTTTNANDCVFGAQFIGTESNHTGYVLTQSGSWVIRQQVGATDAVTPSACRCSLLEQVVGSTGNYAAAVSAGAAGSWVVLTFAVKAAAASFDPSTVPWSDQIYSRPVPVPRLTPPRRLQDYPDPTAAYFLNDPSKLNPASVPSWLPEDRPLPRKLPVVQKAQDYCDPTSLLVLPAPINTGDLVDEWRGLPRFPRPVTIKAQDQTDPTFLAINPAAVNIAALEPDPQTPRPVRRLARLEYQEFADPTFGWFLPSPLPVGYPAWMLQDPGPRLAPRLSMRQGYADPAPVQPVPDIFVFRYTVFDQPATLPRRLATVATAAREDFAAVWSYVAQAQGWDVQAATPARARPRVPLESSAAPVAPVTDSIDLTSGWRQDAAYVPRRGPKTLPGPYDAYVGTPDVYDPQGTSAAIQPMLDRPRPVTSLTRQVMVDPDPAGWIVAAVAFLADPHTGALAVDSATLPRRFPKSLAGETAFILDAALAPSPTLPWTDSATLPRRVPKLPTLEETASPPWYAVAVIIVAGPYWAEAVSVYTAGAEAGMVSTE